MDVIDAILNGVEFEEPTEITISYKQYKEMLKLIHSSRAYNDKHFEEVAYPFVPKNSIYLGGEMASYGDWSYYLTPEGEYVCTYYSIGD